MRTFVVAMTTLAMLAQADGNDALSANSVVDVEPLFDHTPTSQELQQEADRMMYGVASNPAVGESLEKLGLTDAEQLELVMDMIYDVLEELPSDQMLDLFERAVAAHLRQATKQGLAADHMSAPGTEQMEIKEIRAKIDGSFKELRKVMPHLDMRRRFWYELAGTVAGGIIYAFCTAAAWVLGR